MSAEIGTSFYPFEDGVPFEGHPFESYESGGVEVEDAGNAVLELKYVQLSHVDEGNRGLRLTRDGDLVPVTAGDYFVVTVRLGTKAAAAYATEYAWYPSLEGVLRYNGTDIVKSVGNLYGDDSARFDEWENLLREDPYWHPLHIAASDAEEMLPNIAVRFDKTQDETEVE